MIISLRLSKQKGSEQQVQDLDKIKVSRAELESLKNLKTASDLPLTFSVKTEEGEKELQSTELASMWQDKQPPVEVLDVTVHQKNLSEVQFPDIQAGLSERDRLKQEAATILGEKATQYHEIEEEIAKLEQELRDIERFEQAGGVVTDLQAIKEELNKRVESVEELSQRKQALRGRIPQQALNLTGEQLERIRVRLQQARMPGTYQVKLKSSVASDDDDGEEKKANSQSRGKAFLVLVVLTILLGLGGFLLTINVLIPIISLVIAGSLLLMYSVYRKIPYKTEIPEPDLDSENSSVQSKKANKHGEDEAEIAKLENMMLQYSESQILRGELEEIEQQLSEKIGGGTLEQLTQELHELDADIADLEAETAEKAQKWGNVDTLDKRRELELKRIDRTRLETQLIALPKYQEYLQIKTQLDLARLNLFQTELIGQIYSQISGYVSIKQEGELLQGLGSNQQWVGVELTPEQQKHIAIFDSLIKWVNADIITPILLVNWERSLPRRLRGLFEEYLFQNKEKEAQVVYVDLVD